jgi:hypothetical protein
MNTNEFLTTLGWPTAELGDLGSAEWSAPSPGDFSVLSAGIARQSKSIRAWVHQADLEDSKDLLVLEMSVSGDSVAVEKSMVGDPLTESPLEDAIHLFVHMRSGIGKMRFRSSGPLVLPKG